jgi:glycosyltransferase family protein
MANDQLGSQLNWFEKLNLLSKNLPYELGVKYPSPKVVKLQRTLEVIKGKKLSIARFGDGEFNLILGRACIFQNYNSSLSKRLTEILVSRSDRLLVGIPDIFGSLLNYQSSSKSYWRKYLLTNREKIYQILDLDKVYYDAMVTRPYVKLSVTYDKSKKIFSLWKTIWDSQRVVFVKGQNDIFGYDSDLFANMNIAKTITAPSSNAFAEYETILSEVLTEPANTLVLISLGPTATVLASDLAELGYQAFDIGHLHNEYRYFLERHKKA